MADPVGKKKEKDEMITQEEMLKLMLEEVEGFHDEGRDEYMDDMIRKLRKELNIEEEK